MSRWPVLALAVAVVSCGSGSAPAPALGTDSVPGRPPEILDLRPAEGARVAVSPPIAVDLQFSRRAPLTADSLRLLLDGQDVTTAAQVVATRDVPPSRVSLSYAAPSLAPGAHRVEVRFTTGDRAIRYAWSFTIAP